MKKNFLKIEKSIADVAKKVVEVEVNTTCPLIAFQPKLPTDCEKLRKYKK